MIRFIKRRGSITFDGLMGLVYGKNYDPAKEDLEEVLYQSLLKLIEENRIEVYRTPSGHTNYRIPMEKKAHKEYNPVGSNMIGTSDPEGAEKLFKGVIKFMEEEFTVSRVRKAMSDKDRLPQNKVRDLILELETQGLIEATRSKVYMGKAYNLYVLKKVVALDDLGKLKTLEKWFSKQQAAKALECSRTKVGSLLDQLVSEDKLVESSGEGVLKYAIVDLNTEEAQAGIMGSVKKKRKLK